MINWSSFYFVISPQTKLTHGEFKATSVFESISKYGRSQHIRYQVFEGILLLLTMIPIWLLRLRQRTQSAAVFGVAISHYKLVTNVTHV